MIRMSDELEQQLANALIYKLEFTDKEKDLYEAIANERVAEEVVATERAVRVPDDAQYWPFQGEYWIDELGYFQVRTVDECVEVLGGERPRIR